MPEESQNYYRIQTAIAYLHENFSLQPTLDDLAAHVNLSPFHFQKMFLDYTGVSPKKFLQFLTVEHAKNILSGKESNLFETALDTGLSGTGRLHDLFVKIEGMTPGEYKKGGAGLMIHYNFYDTCFGNIFIASTYKGICSLVFIDDETEAIKDFRLMFPNAEIKRETDLQHTKALSFFSGDENIQGNLNLHLKGTGFQLKVWQALLQIPMGSLSSYGKLATEIGSPKASRAAGTAIGDNPVAYIIPCHRVIRSMGVFGQYRWGKTRKAIMIACEMAKTN